MNAELFPELPVSDALTFRGRPNYNDVVNAIAALAPGQLASLELIFTRPQWLAINAEMDTMTGRLPEPRSKLCGFPVVVA